MVTAPKVWFLGPLDRVIYLNTLPALEGLSPSDLAVVAQQARERFFTAGSVILNPGEPAPAFHIVVDGKVAVNRTGRPGQRIGPREAVGFLHLLARDRTGLSARAEVDTVTLELDSELQLAICEEHFRILRQYLRYLCSQSIRERLETDPVGSGPGPEIGLLEDPRTPLDLVQRLLTLRRWATFSRTDLDAMVELARQVGERRLEKGQQLWAEGENAGSFLLPVTGSVVCRCTPSSPLWWVPPVLPTGLEEALAGQPRWYGAAAAQDLLALEVAADPFLDILEDHFEMAIDLVAALSLRLIELQEERARGSRPGPVPADPPRR